MSGATGAATRFFKRLRARTPEVTATPLAGHPGKAPSCVVQASRRATPSRAEAKDGRMRTNVAWHDVTAPPKHPPSVPKKREVLCRHGGDRDGTCSDSPRPLSS